MSDFEKRKFIHRNEKTILPLVSDPESLNSMTQDEVLEIFETKVLRYERSHASADSVQVLLEASQTANFKIVEPLLEMLRTDDHCSGVTLLTDNLAGKKFLEEKEELGLNQIRTEGNPVLADIPAGPYASALVIDEPENTAQSMLLNSAKSVFEARRLYYYSLGLFDSRKKDSLTDVDTVFTTDEFTAKLMRSILSNKDQEIVPVGSPLIDNIDPIEGELHRKKGREKLGLAEENLVVFFSSTVPSAFSEQRGSEKINEVSYDDTLQGLIAAAKSDSSKEFVLLTRNHPAMKGVYVFPKMPEDLPTNLRIVDGDSVTYDEVIYASDIILSTPVSTEIVVAAYRGRKAFLLAYEGEGQLGSITEKLYGEEGIKMLRENTSTPFVNTPATLTNLILEHKKVDPKIKPVQSSVQQIESYLLTGAPTLP